MIEEARLNKTKTAGLGTILLALLYVLECSALLVAMGVYKKGKRSVLVFLSTPFGFVSPTPMARPFAFSVVLNASSLFIGVVIAEFFIRVFTVNTPAGPEFANTLLLPRSWESVVAHNRAILAGSLFIGISVYESRDWCTSGPNRLSY